MHTLSIQATTPSKDKTPASIKKSCVRAPGAKSPTTPKKRKRQDMFAGADQSPEVAAAPALQRQEADQQDLQPSSSKGARPKAAKDSKSPKKGKPASGKIPQEKEEEEEQDEVKKVICYKNEETTKEKRNS